MRATVEISGALGPTFEFADPFRIGRSEECELCVNDEHVSRIHAQAEIHEGSWLLRDLNSTNGLYVGERRVREIRLSTATPVRLGIRGPAVMFEVVSPEPSKRHNEKDEAAVDRVIEHYFASDGGGQPAGERTMSVRKAFQKVQTQQRRRYAYLFGILIACLLGAGAYAIYEHVQVAQQRALAKEIFYSMQSLNVEMADLQRQMQGAGIQDAEQIRKLRSHRSDMEASYDRFLTALNVYDRRMSEQDRLIMRVARIFGECELEMPPEFKTEVMNYIQRWQHSDRFAKAIQTAKENGYISTIKEDFLSQQLPPEFFYLALQESNFDPYVSGPMTRKGIAKGMWQFIPETAAKYGLRVGRQRSTARPDPAR